jgi:hypothetical protein
VYPRGAMLSYSILVIGSELDFIRNYQLGLVEVLNMCTLTGLLNHGPRLN